MGMQSVPSSHSAVILGALTLVTALFGPFLSKTSLSRLFFIYAFLGFSVVAAFSFTVFETQEMEGCSGPLALMFALVLAGLSYAQEGILAQEIGGIWSLAGLWSSAYLTLNLGTHAPLAVATSAISLESVLTTTLSKFSLFKAASIVHANNGLP